MTESLFDTKFNSEPTTGSTVPNFKNQSNDDSNQQQEPQHQQQQEEPQQQQTKEEFDQLPSTQLPSLDDDSNNSALINYRVLVSAKEAGCLIGQNGQVIDSIRDETNTKAGISKLQPGSHERILTLSRFNKFINYNGIKRVKISPVSPNSLEFDFHQQESERLSRYHLLRASAAMSTSNESIGVDEVGNITHAGRVLQLDGANDDGLDINIDMDEEEIVDYFGINKNEDNLDVDEYYSERRESFGSMDPNENEEYFEKFQDIEDVNNDKGYEYTCFEKYGDRRYSNNSHNCIHYENKDSKELGKAKFPINPQMAYMDWERHDVRTLKEISHPLNYTDDSISVSPPSQDNKLQDDENSSSDSEEEFEPVNNGGVHEPFRPGLSKVLTHGEADLLELQPATKFRDLLKLDFVDTKKIPAVNHLRKYKNNLSTIISDVNGKLDYLVLCKDSLLHFHTFDSMTGVPDVKPALKFDTKPSLTTTSDRLISTWPYYPHTINFIKSYSNWLGKEVLGLYYIDPGMAQMDASNGVNTRGHNQDDEIVETELRSNKFPRIIFNTPVVIRRTLFKDDCWTSRPISSKYFLNVQSLRAMTGDPWIQDYENYLHIANSSTMLDLSFDPLQTSHFGLAANWQFFETPVVSMNEFPSSKNPDSVFETAKMTSVDDEYRRIHKGIKHVYQQLIQENNQPSKSLNGRHYRLDPRKHNKPFNLLAVSTSKKLGLFRADNLLCVAATKKLFDLAIPFDEESRYSNRLSITQLIPELLCFIALSQQGLVTVMRLCQHRGVYGMRQELVFPHAPSMTFGYYDHRTIAGLAVRNVSVDALHPRFHLYLTYSDGIVMTYTLLLNEDHDIWNSC
ncbi:hypothetical protein QCA50_017573 [Cerrena zonata]|uniref:K Homology domain-containing protein n=1 Tax=Cerrena zonata TaxID=2478898 RepID=A0AAW0FFI4_9APHY